LKSPVLEVEAAFPTLIIKTQKGRFPLFHLLFLRFLKHSGTARIEGKVNKSAFLLQFHTDVRNISNYGK
jgi:hypothetical protein